MNLVVFAGYGSGKISNRFLKELKSCKSRLFQSVGANTLDEFKNLLSVSIERYDRILVFPIWNEDDKLKRTFKIDFAVEVENLCSESSNCFVFHGSTVGRILGNKLLSNEFFTAKGVRCPRVITEIGDGIVFSNSISGSHEKTYVSDGPLDHTRYNAEYIETSFKYKDNAYYSCVRTMCIGGIITDIFLRFRDVKDGNPNVHGSDTPMDADLQNFYFREILQPHMSKLKHLCADMGAALGLGFYGHDLLLCSKTNNFYVAESSFKFDNILMWKEKINKMLPFVEHEKSIEDSIKHAKYVFCNQIDNLLLRDEHHKDICWK